MIDWLVDRLFAAGTPLQFRKRLTQLFLLLATILAGGALVFALAALAGGNPAARNEIGFAGVLLALNLGIAALLTQNRMAIASLALITALAGGAIAALVAGLSGLSMALALLALLSAAVLARHRAYAVVNIVLFGVLLASAFANATRSAQLFNSELINTLMTVGALAIVSLATRLLAIASERAIAGHTVTGALLNISMDVTELAAHGRKAAEVLAYAAELIDQQFNASHTGIYLLTETGDRAMLIAGTGKAGRQLRNQEYSVRQGAIGAVGQVLLNGEPFIGEPDRRLRAGLDTFFRDSQSQMTIPIRAGETIIGIVDVHSMNPRAFTEADLNALSVLARTVESVARIARRAEQEAQALSENERLRLEAEINQREIERLGFELTRTGWKDFLESRRAVTGLTLANNRMVAESDWTQESIEAGRHRRPVRAAGGNREVVAVPVILRGEVIGAIEVEPDAGQTEAETVDMVQAVAQRLALSLDNARLVEEAQESTAQEQQINELVARFQSAASVDDLLQLTLTELSQTLGADKAAICLGRPAPAHIGEAGHA